MCGIAGLVAIANGSDFRTWILLVLTLWLEARMPAQGAPA
jgi:hypothetical protein